MDGHVCAGGYSHLHCQMATLVLPYGDKSMNGHMLVLMVNHVCIDGWSYLCSQSCLCRSLIMSVLMDGRICVRSYVCVDG